MFHVGMWRERMRNALTDLSEGRPHTAPGNADEINDAELPNGIGTPLADAAARADHLLAELIELYGKLGDRPFEWNIASTTTDALLRNSFTHPRVHLHQYLRENGDVDAADRLFEDAASRLRAASAPPQAMGTVLYNLACVRARQGRDDEALELLEEALPMRADMKAVAAKDEDLAALRDDPRFQELVKA